MLKTIHKLLLVLLVLRKDASLERLLLSLYLLKYLHLDDEVKLTLIQRLHKLAEALGELKNTVSFVLRLITNVLVSFFEALTNYLVGQLGQNLNF